MKTNLTDKTKKFMKTILYTLSLFICVLLLNTATPKANSIDQQTNEPNMFISFITNTMCIDFELMPLNLNFNQWIIR